MGTSAFAIGKYAAARSAGSARSIARRLMRSRIVFKRGSLRPEHAVFVAALVFRLIALTRLVTSGALNPSGGDMLFYQQWAERILHGQLTDHFAFYGLPLYPFWLAALYKLVGVSPFVPLLFQAIADATTALIIYKIGQTTFRATESNRVNIVAVIASAGWICFVPAEAYSLVLMPTSFAVVAFWFAIWCAFNPSMRRYLAAGFALGICAMAVANVLVAAPLLLWRAIVRRHVAASVALLATIAVGTAPCWIYNVFIARDRVFLSAHGGINLWIGNHAGATGYPHFAGLRSGQAELLAQSIDLAEAAAGHSLKRSQVSEFWSAKARSYIVAQPAAWLALLGRKFANLWNAFEYDDIGVIQQLRRANVIFAGLHFGVIAAFAIPGILLAWRVAPKSRILLAAVLLCLGALLAIFITERYRLLAVPGLLLLASFGIVEFARAIVVRDRGIIALYLLALLACTAFVSIPRRDRSLWALSAYNAGREALEAGDLTAAETALQRARAYVPQNPEVNFALGNLRLAQGNRAAAQQFYIATLTLDRRHKGALSNLGVLALEQNQLDDAEMYFRQALTYAPNDAKNHFLLARTLFMRGDRAAAAAETKRALTLNPQQREFIQLREQIEGTAP